MNVHPNVEFQTVRGEAVEDQGDPQDPARPPQGRTLL